MSVEVVSGWLRSIAIWYTSNSFSSERLFGLV